MTLDPDLAYWCEMAEAHACRDLFVAAASAPDDPVRAATASPGGAVAFALGAFDIGFFNRTIGVGVARSAVEADVDEVVRFYDGLERTVSAAQLAPHATPSEVVGWFEARGYVASRWWVKMWHDLASIPDAPTDLRIEVIGRDQADDFARIGLIDAYGFPSELTPIASAAVGRPGWIHYLGFDGETPVSSAAMRIADGVAWLGFGATTEAYRGRGGQSAMFARRLRDARDAGCRFAITETGKETPEMPNPSYRNMIRSGFRLAYPRRNWNRLVGG